MDPAVVDALLKLAALVGPMIGVSGWLKPVQMKRVAAAQVQVDRTLALGKVETNAQVADAEAARARSHPTALALPNPNTIDAVLEEAPKLLDRAHQRDDTTAARRQNNVEQIARLAAEELEGEGSVAGPVNVDFAPHLLTIAQDVSAGEMQRLWAKILAGEVVKPGTFSVRTLHVVKTLSQEEARLFEELALFVADGSNVIKTAAFRKYGPSVSSLLKLEEAGLIDQAPSLHVTINRKIVTFYDLVILIEDFDKGIRPRFDIIPLTSAGIALYGLLQSSGHREYVKEIALSLRADGFNVMTVPLVRQETQHIRPHPRPDRDLFPEATAPSPQAVSTGRVAGKSARGQGSGGRRTRK